MRDIAWVPANDNNCYRPWEVLPRFDFARPEVPYSILSDDLIEAIREIGINFGEGIPEAHSIIRLQMEGSNANIDRLLELVDNAVDEVQEDPVQSGQLRDLLFNHPFIPVPIEHTTPDRLSRVPFSRIVMHAGAGKLRRSDLMGWVVAKEKYDHDSKLMALLDKIENFSEKELPFTTDFNQTIGFLEWVWKAEPEAEKVRSYLRSAYDYCMSDLERMESKEGVREFIDSAKVFTSKKRWVPAKHSYYDDIQKSVLRAMIADVELATPGHLGSDHATVKEVAKLLALKPLSHRIRIECQYGDDLSTPGEWNERLIQIFRVVRGFLNADFSFEDEDSDSEQFSNVRLRRVSEISRIVFDNEQRVHEKDTHANFEPDRGEIFVKGELEDIAPELCEIVVDILQLSQRGELVAKITPALFALGNDKRFSKMLRNLKDFCGIDDTDSEREAEVAQEPTSSIDESVEDEQRQERSKRQPKQDREEDTIAQRPSKVYEQTSSNEREDEDRASPDRGSAHQKSETRERRRRISRVVTYVVPNDVEESIESNAEIGIQDDQQIRIGDEGEMCVMELEKSEGRTPHRMPRNHPGYDIESYGAEHDDVRYIEVKAIDGPWTDVGVGITDRQYKEAQKKGDSFWLYVVENTSSEEPIVHRFQNPVSLIGSYRFDANWRGLAKSSAEGIWPDAPLLSGQPVKVDGEDAEIIEVVRYGNADAVRVRFKSSENIQLIIDRRRIELLG